MSCRTSKIDSNTEKIANEGEDYIIEKYKMRKRQTGGAYLTFDVTTKGFEIPAKYFYLSVNGISFDFPNDKNTLALSVESGNVYKASIATLGYKTIYINSIKPRQSDSIVVKARLFEEENVILY
ncbi:hypothetical protein RCZ04_22330 [Capnocytophaga sp. HP1101]